MLLEQGMRELQDRQIVAKAVFKLTGRYILDDNFDYQRFNNSCNVFRMATSGDPAELKPGYTYTSFYKIDNIHLKTFWQVLSRTIATLQEMISNKWIDGMPICTPRGNAV